MRFIFGLTTSILLGTSAVSALDIGAMSAEERAIFREEVRSYLLENPEVLVEAISVLEARQAEEEGMRDTALVAANQDALLNDGHSWVGGNPEGDITIVEFIDYRCGYCRRAHPEVQELVASDGNIRLIVKEFPILGEASTLSSRFAIATKQVAGDDAYKAVHEALITLRGQTTEATLARISDDLGLDTDAILASMNSPDVDSVIAANRALADALQISGTPSFVMGAQMLRGYVPLEGMRDVIAQERG